MSDKTLDLTVELAPRARFDLVDLRRHFVDEHAALSTYPHTLYWSCHTTAGFLEPGLAARLSEQGIPNYLEAFRTLFPEGAGYEHDRLERREDLDSAQRAIEPRNADSHLAFMASGLRTCVTHANRPNEPVFFVDLDGINGGQPRRRRARFVGFTQERVVGPARIEVPVSAHPIDSINLKDPRLGVYGQLADFVKRAGVGKGKLRVSLDTSERHSALTVNEYETLLMKYDLAEVLANPLRFAAEKYRHALADPRAVPAKTLDYAKYDLVQLFNEAMDRLRISESSLERLLSRFLALPAARFLRMKRTLSLPVSATSGRDGLLYGTYQSPILVQWQQAPRSARILDATLTELL